MTSMVSGARNPIGKGSISNSVPNLIIALVCMVFDNNLCFTNFGVLVCEDFRISYESKYEFAIFKLKDLAQKHKHSDSTECSVNGYIKLSL